MKARTLDVSRLPIGTNDSRALLGWGNVGMLMIEGTMFALCVAAYFYLRTVNLDWPPPTVQPTPLALPIVNLLISLLGLVPMRMADRAALRQETRRTRLGLAICVAIGITFCVIRGFVLSELGFLWSSHAYGSMIWTILGLHSLHAIAVTGEIAVLLVYSLVRPLTKKQFLDIRTTAVYWYFVVLTWVPLFAIVHLSSYVGRK